MTSDAEWDHPNSLLFELQKFWAWNAMFCAEFCNILKSKPTAALHEVHWKGGTMEKEIRTKKKKIWW